MLAMSGLSSGRSTPSRLAFIWRQSRQSCAPTGNGFAPMM
jgi:hypothetical protein